ncbi:MAG: cysteine--tRNA ligase [Patescibacteria group bacterium]
MMLKLYNTLTRKKQIFKPIKKKKVGLYTCGPTVYFFAHIGNMRTFLFEDILKRVLEYNNYKVKHVMNITDVGHLTSDEDTGEDKIEKGAKREKKTVWQVAEFYTKAFQKDLKRLNIQDPNVWIKATDTIKEQINLIKTLENKGFTYITSDGVYFDTSKLKDYGKLQGKKQRKIKPGARTEMRDKKNTTDFALWKFTSKGEKRQMEWDTPWGRGFPGWHTECVVMGAKELGVPFDIHCGGIDHIAVHHTNEIAQAEVAYEKILSNYWLHGEFLNLKDAKMSKSKGNIITVEILIEKGFSPIDFRYLTLGAHYRSELVFSWEAMEFAQNSLNNLKERIEEIIPDKKVKKLSLKAKVYQKKFQEHINNDLDVPQALALAWRAIKDKKISNSEKYHLLINFDKVFGLKLNEVEKTKIPAKIQKLTQKREEQRKKKDWKSADETRKEIEKLGYTVEDLQGGIKIKKK